MTDFNQVDHENYGDPSASHAMWITILKADKADNTYLQWAWEGINHAVGKIVNNSSVPGGKVRKVLTNNALDCGDIFGSAETWRKNHSYFDEDGCYIWVTNCETTDHSGGAESWNSFEEQTDAWVTTQISGEYKFKAFSIQEALHGFILANCSKVQGLTGDGNNEHSLGHISDQGAAGDLTSPMVYTYVDDGLHTNGSCDRYANSEGPTKVITWCTVDAVDYSKEHAYWNGAH